MPFESVKPLDDYINLDAVDRCGRDIAEAAGDRLELNVKRETPVNDSPFRDRKARVPSTARESVHRGPVTDHAGFPGWEVSVSSDDPIFPYIEYPTRPHIIRPRDDRGAASVADTGKSRGTVDDGRASLSWMGPGGRRFAKVVHHPGTHGQYPMAKGLAKTAAELGQLAREPLRKFSEEVIK